MQGWLYLSYSSTYYIMMKNECKLLSHIWTVSLLKMLRDHFTPWLSKGLAILGCCIPCDITFFRFMQVYRGYFGTNKVGSSYKEGFEIARDLPKDDPDYESSFPISEHSAWPQASEGEDSAPYQKFKETMKRYHTLLREVALDLTHLISIGLGMRERYLDGLFTKDVSTLRLINYPVHDFDPKDGYTADGKLVSTEQHRDTSVLTILTTFDYEGLQVI